MLPFFKEVSYPLGVFGFVVLTYLVIVGSSNAVNLTDGLDGLAIMPVVMVGSALGVFAYVTGSAVYSKYLFFPHIPGSGELLIFCAAMAGAGLAFLWFNTHPAQVFMGDVGALALGGALGTIAVIVRQEIVLAIMGGIFVVEALSVMLQVIVLQVHQAQVRRGPAPPEDGAAAPPFRKERLEGDAGGRALLDHHHAAVPGRPVDPETAMNPTNRINPGDCARTASRGGRRCRRWSRAPVPAGAMRRGAGRAAPDAPAAPRRRRTVRRPLTGKPGHAAPARNADGRA